MLDGRVDVLCDLHVGRECRHVIHAGPELRRSEPLLVAVGGCPPHLDGIAGRRTERWVRRDGNRSSVRWQRRTEARDPLSDGEELDDAIRCEFDVDVSDVVFFLQAGREL